MDISDPTNGGTSDSEILHVDIAVPLETLQVAAVECLIVFRWKDYPVGQLRQSGDPGRSIALKPLVESFVDREVLRLAEQAAIIFWGPGDVTGRQ